MNFNDFNVKKLDKTELLEIQGGALYVTFHMIREAIKGVLGVQA